MSCLKYMFFSQIRFRNQRGRSLSWVLWIRIWLEQWNSQGKKKSWFEITDFKKNYIVIASFVIVCYFNFFSGVLDISKASKQHRLKRYHSQTYINGSKCDLDGNPRETEVRVRRYDTVFFVFFLFCLCAVLDLLNQLQTCSQLMWSCYTI